MRVNNKLNKHLILILLLICSLILQSCNLGSTGNTGNSTSESVSNDTSSSNITLELTTKETTKETTQEIVQETSTSTSTTTMTSTTVEETISTTTINTPNEPYQVEFTHNDVSFVVPGNKIMPADTDIKTAVDPVLNYPWQLVEDPIQVEFMEYIYDHLISQEILFYDGHENFLIDFSQFVGKIPEQTLIELVYTVLESDPRFFTYENNVSFIYDQNDLISEILVYVDYEYQSSNPLEASAEDYQDVIEEVKAIAQNIMDTTSNTWQRIRMAHDYIIFRVDYDPSEDGIHTKNNVYDAILGEDKLTKCVGYSQAFALILAAMQIDVTMVSGTTNVPHAWNLVYFEDSWYSVDVTMDDYGIAGLEVDFLHEATVSNFLRGSETMSRSHTPYFEVELSFADNDSGYKQLNTYFESTEEIEQGITEFINKINLEDDIDDVFDFWYTGEFDYYILTEIANEAIENNEYKSEELKFDWMIYGHVIRLYFPDESMY